jgi:hypothetical protein
MDDENSFDVAKTVMTSELDELMLCPAVCQ